MDNFIDLILKFQVNHSCNCHDSLKIVFDLLVVSSFSVLFQQTPFYSVEYCCRYQRCIKTGHLLRSRSWNTLTHIEKLIPYFPLFVFTAIPNVSAGVCLCGDLLARWPLQSFCSVPAPSLVRPVHVWYCFTTGKMFSQRLWIPEPTVNTQRMSPSRSTGWSGCFSLHLDKYWSLIIPNITPRHIPAILLILFGFISYCDPLPRKTRRLSCELCREMSDDSQHRASHFVWKSNSKKEVYIIMKDY